MVHLVGVQQTCDVVHLSTGSIGWTNRWSEGRLAGVALLKKPSVQIVRRTYSAPNIPETTFFGSWESGSLTGACSRLTALSAFVRLSNAPLPFKGS